MFPNAVEGTALDFLHTHLSMDAPFPKIVQVMSRQYNSEHRQQQLLSQMQASMLEKFLKEQKHESLSDGLDALVAEINRIVPQLYDGLNTEQHKLNFLREAVINYQWLILLCYRHRPRS